MAPDHRDGENIGTGRTDRSARIVIVDRRSTLTAAGVDDVVARCHIRAHRVSSACAIERCADGCGIALIAVADQPPRHDPVLDDVRAVQEKGYTVLCCANGVGAWPLGAQCRLLLAGALDVLDCGVAAFADDLHERLVGLLHAASERERETRDLTRQMARLGMVGASPRIIAVFRSIVAVSAVSDLPVLVTGETGTGKELAARAIHQLDPRRREHPFVAINCGALCSGIAESELFGHRRGAFTGAERERQGLVRAAGGGVLFLDEIGDLEWSLQAKLLRVLQERRVLAVGDDHEVGVDVRVIAATNRDLEDLVRQGAFRADLFHRLNVLGIRIPSLRDRAEDVEPLVAHFVAQCARQSAHLRVTVSPEFVDALRRVDLPGNIRQLENIVRHAVVTSGGGQRLGLNSLPPDLWAEISRADAGSAPPDTAGHAAPPAPAARSAESRPPLDPVAVLDATEWKLQEALALCEQHLVAAALCASRGNQSRAARLLGISPRCIFNKMRKHRLIA